MASYWNGTQAEKMIDPAACACLSVGITTLQDIPTKPYSHNRHFLSSHFVSLFLLYFFFWTIKQNSEAFLG